MPVRLFDLAHPLHTCDAPALPQASQSEASASDGALALRPRGTAVAHQLQPWEVDFREVKLHRCVGQGSFGRVRCCCEQFVGGRPLGQSCGIALLLALAKARPEAQPIPLNSPALPGVPGRVA